MTKKRAKLDDLTQADRDIIDRIIKHRLLCGEEPDWNVLTLGCKPRPSWARVYKRIKEIQALVDMAEVVIDTAIVGLR